MGKEQLKNYVNLFRVGEMFLDRRDVREIHSRKPEDIQLPDNVFAFQFFDRQEYLADNGELLIGKEINLSPCYLTCRVMNIAELRRERPLLNIEAILAGKVDKNIEEDDKVAIIPYTKNSFSFEPMQKDWVEWKKNGI